MRASTSSSRAAWLVVLACAAAYAPCLGAREFFHDDRAWIVSNPLLHQGLSALPKIFTTGYVEPVLGRATPIQEYRPLLVLSFLAQTATTGFSAAPMRAANIALHALVCLLLLASLKRRVPLEAAAAAALLFAVLPVHAEAVALISWRSELLTAAAILAAWLCLEDGRIAAGTALYGAGMLVKEHAVLFPIFYALADWTFHGKKPWQRPRVYQALGACALGYFAVRSLVLSQVMHGGVPYFASRLTALLTLPRFYLLHYLWPSAMGLGLCSDYSRPLIADETASSPSSWLCLIALIVIVVLALKALRRRAAWAFWFLAPCIFLLPTSHLVFPLDTIGAERFLYIPTMGLAAGLGWLFHRLAARRRTTAYAGMVLLAGWYLCLTARRASAWSSARGFYEAAVSCNPVSGRARNGLGEALVARGDGSGAREQWWRAVELDPLSSDPFYNLARLEWDSGNKQASEVLARRALVLDPQSTDAWVLLSLALKDKGDADGAFDALRRALDINPDDALAHYNMGRLSLERLDPAAAVAHFSRFVALAPDDPDAARVRELLRSMNVLPR